MLSMVLLFIGTTEVIVIGGVALLIFGGKKLPELMRGLGKGVKEFKEGMREINTAQKEHIDSTEHCVDGHLKDEENIVEKPLQK